MNLPSPHALVNPVDLAPAVGFAHAVTPVAGRAVHVAGQIASGPDGAVVGSSLTEQFDVALSNMISALAAAGARPEHLVSMLVFTTAMTDYRTSRREIGTVWRARLGRHFPAVALLGVTELYEPSALVEIVAWAVVPDINAEEGT